MQGATWSKEGLDVRGFPNALIPVAKLRPRLDKPRRVKAKKSTKKRIRKRRGEEVEKQKKKKKWTSLRSCARTIIQGKLYDNVSAVV